MSSSTYSGAPAVHALEVTEEGESFRGLLDVLFTALDCSDSASHTARLIPELCISTSCPALDIGARESWKFVVTDPGIS